MKQSIQMHKPERYRKTRFDIQIFSIRLLCQRTIAAADARHGPYPSLSQRSSNPTLYRAPPPRITHLIPHSSAKSQCQGFRVREPDSARRAKAYKPSPVPLLEPSRYNPSHNRNLQVSNVGMTIKAASSVWASLPRLAVPHNPPSWLSMGKA